jgi:hypothetical protein
MWNAKPMQYTESLLDAYRLIGDPLLDEAVEQAMQLGETSNINAVMRSLVHHGDPQNISIPEAIRNYLASDPLPGDVDHDRINRAQHFFQVWGFHISAALFCGALPMSYSAAKGVKVLHETARLETDVRRRIFETGQFVMDVMAPHGLTEKGNGIRSVQRVRLLHAAIRRLILDNGEWDVATLGVPINQEDLAGTMLSFAECALEWLPKFGIAVTQSNAEDYLYTWTIVARMLGMVDELVPANVEQARSLRDIVLARQSAASAEGIEVTRALVDFLEEMTPHFLHRHPHSSAIVPSMIRHLLGDETADKLGVRNHLGRRLAGTKGARYLELAETALERHNRLKILAEPFSKSLLKAMFAYQRGGIRPSFEMPESLQWNLRIEEGPTL